MKVIYISARCACVQNKQYNEKMKTNKAWETRRLQRLTLLVLASATKIENDFWENLNVAVAQWENDSFSIEKSTVQSLWQLVPATVISNV